MTAPSPQDRVSAQVDALKKPLAGRRRWSWLLFVALLSIALLIPAVSSLMQKPAATAAGQPKPAAAGMDNWWNPGPVSASHHRWAENCTVCHSQPFARVQDKDCQSCHADTRQHVANSEAHGKQSGIADLRCASCHREHQGEFGLLEQSRHFVGSQCSSCHADLKAKAPETALGNASNFADAHPDFRVQIATADGLQLRQQQPGATMSEPTPMKFSHAAHLAVGGIKAPQGTVEMQCSDCHRPTADGRHFEAITMAGQCQSCHALNFDPALPDRQVPHGDVDAVLSTLMEFYSFKSQQAPSAVEVDSAANRFRPGKTQAQPQAATPPATQDAKAQAAAAATRLFEETSCVVCHTVTSVAGPGPHATPGRELPQWKIEPPAAPHAWLPAARFDHSAHKSMDCTGCHAAAQSKQASDVLIPTIDTCRSCHAGSQAPVGKVPSDCGLCHDFHTDMRASLQQKLQSSLAPALCPAGEPACKP